MWRSLRRRSAPATATRTPPRHPPGWATGPPDFVGVGVQRAGTSWWFAVLAGHPHVAAPPGEHKELHFFDAFSDRDLGPDDVARYHAWFPRPEGALVGEWTPSYAYDPWCVPMLVHAAPSARLLLMLRDPIERFRSGLFFSLRRGFSHADAVRDAYHRGLYAPQVARVLGCVPRDRVLVLTYEAARDDTEGARRATAAFLGLDPDLFPGPVEVRAAKKRRARTSRELPDELLPEIAARYRDDLTSLARLLPDLDFGRWSTASS